METKVNFEVQYKNQAASEECLVERARQVWRTLGRDVAEIKTLDMYIKPEDNKVYYVVNGKESGSFYLF